mmetsp:Transcript_18034/g.32113  ORF Transcript_18034/g.32113 Transcript_18034/m.32113 type:complete len:322 (+) Transcript_18034:281-1246(+)
MRLLAPRVVDEHVADADGIGQRVAVAVHFLVPTQNGHRKGCTAERKHLAALHLSLHLGDLPLAHPKVLQLRGLRDELHHALRGAAGEGGVKGGQHHLVVVGDEGDVEGAALRDVALLVHPHRLTRRVHVAHSLVRRERVEQIVVRLDARHEGTLTLRLGRDHLPAHLTRDRLASVAWLGTLQTGADAVEARSAALVARQPKASAPRGQPVSHHPVYETRGGGDVVDDVFYGGGFIKVADAGLLGAAQEALHVRVEHVELSVGEEAGVEHPVPAVNHVVVHGNHHQRRVERDAAHFGGKERTVRLARLLLDAIPPPVDDLLC